ncbi:kinase-like domain-containing protein [Hygrophoropsis aurantiaca]|uniref:Kinase-like domain-containing protein n=1 Tax=Hygrophoropsis aurantiaca TaxID=72124 RepID=A0ACB8AFD4_9AGAM|nr:kinase-like domain-containing protein [Hygrophoropsis aurantiaca]
MGSDPKIARLGEALGYISDDSGQSEAASIPVSLINDAPVEWLDRNIIGIRRILEELAILSSEEYAGFDAVLYPRFYVYALAHMKLCTHNLRAVESLQSKCAKWISLDEISHLANHHSISDTIFSYLTRCKNKHTHDLTIAPCLEKLLRLDKLCLTARVTAMLSDSENRMAFLNQRKSKAQTLVNLLQAILDLNTPDLKRSRSLILSAATDLSEIHGVHPQCLNIAGVHFETQVSGGYFADIWKAKIEHVSGEEAPSSTSAVAIKVARNVGVDNTNKAYAKQALLWRQLMHPCVVPLYGVYHWPDKNPLPCLVSPWMDNGTILEYLKQNPQEERQPLVLDVARGLEYLHTFDPPIIHGNLKGSNILVSPSFRACIAGFGSSTFLQTFSSATKSGSDRDRGHGPPGPGSTSDPGPTTSQSKGSNRNAALRWMAPEVLREQEVGSGSTGKTAILANDVYSFGCVCYEIYVGRPRFAELSAFQTILAVTEGRPVPRPANTQLDGNDEMWALIKRCWEMDPPMRPWMSEIVRVLVGNGNGPVPVCDWDGGPIDDLRAVLLNDPATENVGRVDAPNNGENATLQPPPHEPVTKHVRQATFFNEPLCSRNIVVFGEAGVGKSSLVNLILNSSTDIAPTSSHTAACTLDVRDYTILLSGIPFRIFDTVGLNEPANLGNGKAYLDSIDKAYRLVTSLRAAGGIHLLLFCMRGGRITASARQNFALFWDFLCDRKVRVAMVVTHLETKVPMEAWWPENKGVVENYGIHTVAHACVTTLRPSASEPASASQEQQDKYESSRSEVYDLLLTHGTHDAPYTVETSAAWTATLARRLLDFLESLRIRPPKRSVKGIVGFLTREGIMSREDAEIIARRIKKVDADAESDVGGGGSGGGVRMLRWLG